MGNGPRLTGTTVDLTTSTPLSQDDLELAIDQVSNSFGKPDFIMMQALQVQNYINTFGLHSNPEYAGTPWQDYGSLTKRERAVAGLHTTLNKLKILKNISFDEMTYIGSKCRKRLKRARWARYNKKV